MANIAQDLPSGQALVLNPAQAGAYGDHASTSVVAGVAVLTTRDGVTVATCNGTYAVDLDVLDQRADASKIVPYVNAFLGGDLRVEKNWRTKTYRIPGQAAPSKPRAAVQPAQPIASFAPVATTVGGTAVIEPTVVTDITAVEVPKKQPVKRLRKGWSRIGDIMVKDEHLDRANDAWALSQSGVPAAMIITGPAGTAKTAFARAFAASLGVPFLKVDGGAIRTADDWAGATRQDPNTKVWSHVWSPFAQVLRLGQPCVVLVDEITRTESPQALNAMMGLLDWTGQMLVTDAAEVLRLPAGVLVIATANIGPEFVGTLPLDGAVRQRFPNSIRMAYPGEEIEAALLHDLTGVDIDIATQLVTMAVTQRANRLDPQMYPSGAVISTRTLLDICRKITTCGRSPRAAIWATLDGQFDPEDDAALSVCVDTQFPPEPVEEDEDLTEVTAEDAEAEAPWSCPSCGRANSADMVVCWGHDCTYTRPAPTPVAPTTITLQNQPYGQP